MKKSEEIVLIQEDTLPIFKKSLIKLGIALALFLMVMLSDKNIRTMFEQSDPRLIACMGMLFFYALYMLSVEFRQLYQDVRIVEDLLSDKDRANLNSKEIPLEVSQANSFFVRKYALMSSKDLKGEISSFMEKSLVSEYQRANKHLDTIGAILPLLGLAGTMLGLSQALASVAEGQDIVQGVSYAFGTTLVGIFGYMVISAMNSILKDKKTEVFYSFLDLVSSLAKKEVNDARR